MSLAMSRPWKHPKSGVYWVRKRVPDDLLKLVGKLEEKRSLQTRDPGEAKRRHAEALVEIEGRWANLRAGPKVLTEREAHQLAVAVHDRWLQQHLENPSQQTAWNVDLADQLFAPPPRLKSYDILDPDFEGSMDGDILQISKMEKWCFEIANECLAAHGLRVDQTSRRVLAGAIAAALQRASLTLASLAKGFNPSVNFFPVQSTALQSSAASRQPVAFKQLVDGWAAERRPVAKTQYEWSRVVRQLEAYLGHSDAQRLTGENLIDWKRSMVEAGLRPKTIQDAKLAPLRAILQWGVQNKLIPLNPAEGISLDVRSKQGEKKRSFTDAEAKLILQAALAEKDPVRKWVPWIGAYSGARVSEICQLRSEDIIQIEQIWCMKLDPEAGSLKTSGSERLIPLHPALIEAGFLDFVGKAKSGPLFASLSPDKFGKRGGNGTKVIGRFVRQLGLTDTRLSPSHSWRHRIKTSGRKYGLAQDILDAVTGHGARSVADSYGEFPVEALFREICKIPEIKLKS
jgi:integrase